MSYFNKQTNTTFTCGMSNKTINNKETVNEEMEQNEEENNTTTNGTTPHILRVPHSWAFEYCDEHTFKRL